MNMPKKGASKSENPVIRTLHNDVNTPGSNTLKVYQQMACAFTLGEVRNIHNRGRLMATERYIQAAVWELNYTAVTRTKRKCKIGHGLKCFLFIS
jgi:hypothetical protein